MIGSNEPLDSQPPGCQEDGIEELPDGTPRHLQHGRELRRDQRLSCGGGIGVGVHQYRRDHGKDGLQERQDHRQLVDGAASRPGSGSWRACPLTSARAHGTSPLTASSQS